MGGVEGSTQTAISIVGIIGRITSFVTAVPGGYLGDRFGRLNVMRCVACCTAVIPSLIMANTVSYTVVRESHTAPQSTQSLEALTITYSCTGTQLHVYACVHGIV